MVYLKQISFYIILYHFISFISSLIQMKYYSSNQPSFSNYCDYLNPSNGKPCTHWKLYKSNFCHKKSHYPTNELYTESIQTVRTHFESISSPLPPMDNLDVYNPPMNGACLYSCFVKYLMHHPAVYENANNPFHSLIHSYLSNLGTEEDNQNIYRMQILLKDYICEHRDEMIEDNFTWSLLVEECHQMSIRDYDMYYNIAASLGEKVNGRIVPSRWGSMVELLAFSRIFGISVRIYKTIHINAKYQIEECITNQKNMRLQLVQDIGESPSSDFNSDTTVHLINVRNHYILVYGHI